MDADVLCEQARARDAVVAVRTGEVRARHVAAQVRQQVVAPDARERTPVTEVLAARLAERPRVLVHLPERRGRRGGGGGGGGGGGSRGGGGGGGHVGRHQRQPLQVGDGLDVEKVRVGRQVQLAVLDQQVVGGNAARRESTRLERGRGEGEREGGRVGGRELGREGGRAGEGETERDNNLARPREHDMDETRFTNTEVVCVGCEGISCTPVPPQTWDVRLSPVPLPLPRHGI